MSNKPLIRLVANTIAGVHLHWNGYNKKPADLYTAMAERLADAQLVQSPEVAAEVERLRADLDKCQRRYTEDTAELKRQIAGLDDLRLRAIDKGDQLRARVAELEAAPAPGKCGRELSTGQPCPDHPRPRPFVSDSDRKRRTLAETLSQAEDPHDSPLHHTYAVCRDLPEARP